MTAFLANNATTFARMLMGAALFVVPLETHLVIIALLITSTLFKASLHVWVAGYALEI